jgi:acid phosphatase type 7
LKILKKAFCIVVFFTFVFFAEAQQISRGPYLQSRTSTSIIFKYLTTQDTESTVKYGFHPDSLSYTKIIPGIRANHEVKIEGLLPNKAYYYAVFNGPTQLVGGSSYFFKTSQLENSTQKIRIWATGDCGTAYATQTKVLNAFDTYLGNKYLDAWLLLGDNAYVDGTDAEYQANFFNPYKDSRFLRQTCIYPAPGNHDYYATTNGKATKNVPYYQIFSMPAAGEAGGLASNRKEYYSYNIGNVHFISLDSYGVETNANLSLYDTLGPQATWLKQDLAANTKKWTVVYFHHPPYTMGSHNSDTEQDLVKMRKNLTPIFLRYNVDLVLSGHSHNYERSKMLKAYTGFENEFNETLHVLSTSSGKYDGSTNSCPYHKKSDNSIKGTVYAVAGSAGKVGGWQPNYPHNALPFIQTGTLGGSMYLEVEKNRLDAFFVNENGQVADKFTMLKDMNQRQILNVPLQENAVEIQSPYLEPTFWNNDPIPLEKINLASTGSVQNVYIKDTKNCLQDTLEIRPNRASLLGLLLQGIL